VLEGPDPVSGAECPDRGGPAQSVEPRPTPPPRGEGCGATEAEGLRELERAPQLLVRVLGDIDVVGGPLGLTALQTAVVSYIAVHGPVTASGVEDAVWTAPTSNRRKRLANTVSAARAALGAQHLPPLSDGRYRLGDSVELDVHLLEERVAAAATQKAEVAIETLRDGLALVRGAPFGYRWSERRYFVWVDFENAAVAAERLVIDAAVLMGELCLTAGDFTGASWAASHGRLVSPTNPQLTELLMRAFAGGGDRHAARRVFENHRNALAWLDLDEVAESTVELYRELVSSHLSTTALTQAHPGTTA